MFFSEPPLSRYDLRFRIGRIPIRVHPLFWLMTLLLGASARDLPHLLIWIPIVFVSILVHELGHAFVLWQCSVPSHVVLQGGGGLTVPEPERWGNRWATVSLRPGQEILVSLAGPCAGFLLASLVMLGVVASGGFIFVSRLFYIVPVPAALLPTSNEIANLVVMDLLWVNFFWGLINLLPVYPLDGGNIARYLLLKLDPLYGIRTSLWISVIVGGIVAILGLVSLGSIYIAFLFGYVAFQSYQVLLGRSGSGY